MKLLLFLLTISTFTFASQTAELNEYELSSSDSRIETHYKKVDGQIVKVSSLSVRDSSGKFSYSHSCQGSCFSTTLQCSLTGCVPSGEGCSQHGCSGSNCSGYNWCSKSLLGQIK